jgi:hypothetical protein
VPHHAGVGIHVPSGVYLRGEKGWGDSRQTSDQTIIRAATPLRALILVTDDLDTGGDVVDSEVSHLTLIGSAAIMECDSAGINMSSITDLDRRPPAIPSVSEHAFLAEHGVLVDESSAGQRQWAGLSTNVHHVLANHL